MKYLLLFLTCLSLQLHAEDIFPPSWRGEPNTTIQGFEAVTLHPGPFATGYWTNVLNHADVWDLGQTGLFSFRLPTNVVQASLQITVWRDGWIYVGPSIYGAPPDSAARIVSYFAWGHWLTISWQWTPQGEPIVILGVPYPHGLLVSDLILDLKFADSGSRQD